MLICMLNQYVCSQNEITIKSGHDIADDNDGTLSKDNNKFPFCSDSIFNCSSFMRKASAALVSLAFRKSSVDIAVFLPLKAVANDVVVLLLILLLSNIVELFEFIRLSRSDIYN